MAKTPGCRYSVGNARILTVCGCKIPYTADNNTVSARLLEPNLFGPFYPASKVNNKVLSLRDISGLLRERFQTCARA